MTCASSWNYIPEYYLEITLKANKNYLLFFRNIYFYVPSPEFCVLSLRIRRDPLCLTCATSDIVSAALMF
jgi:hypothetical protein